MTATRGLKTGDLVTVPAGTGRREVVVESVAWDGLQFTDPRGAGHLARGAELVPPRGAAPVVSAA